MLGTAHLDPTRLNLRTVRELEVAVSSDGSGTVIENRPRGYELQQMRARMRAERPLCARCEERGRVRVWDELDHVVPLSRGGEARAWANLQGLCLECHAEKSAAEETERRAARR